MIIEGFGSLVAEEEAAAAASTGAAVAAEATAVEGAGVKGAAAEGFGLDALRAVCGHLPVPLKQVIASNCS